MEKPLKLYRGLHLNYDDFNDFNLGSDLISPYDPVIDEKGRQRLRSGNEYGVYMTTNKNMALDIYGNVHNGGMCLNNSLQIGMYSDKLILPAVGIVYEIDTTNLDIRKPWISREFESTYNSNYEGDEFITDIVPAQNCKIVRIIIGKDILHDKELVEIDSNLDRLKEHIMNILNNRRLHLQLLEKALLKRTPLQVRKLGFDDIEVYKEIFGYNGVNYIDIKDIDTMCDNDIIKYLLYYYYKQMDDNIDFKILKYICALKRKIFSLPNEEKVDCLIGLIMHDLDTTNKNKDSFIIKNSVNGQLPNTLGFDNKIRMLKDILIVITNRLNEINNNNQESIHKMI